MGRLAVLLDRAIESISPLYGVVSNMSMPLLVAEDDAMSSNIFLKRNVHVYQGQNLVVKEREKVISLPGQIL